MARDVPQAVRSRVAAARERWDRTTAEFTRRQVMLLRVLRFLVVFTVLAAPLYMLLASGWEARGIRAATAAVSAAVLDLAGMDAASSGTFVSAPGILLDVSRDSTGWKSLLAFTALVVATRAPWRDRLEGLMLGLVVVAIANVLRITTMVVAVVVFGIDYELLHLVLWRWGLTGVVLVGWLLWLREPAPFRGAYRWLKEKKEE